jgi:hypothetical protein
MNKISVHNNWDPLEEIWLGDVWPTHFYDDLESEVRDKFYELTEMTKEDLNIIQKKFEEFGVIVRRPHIDESNKEKYIDPVVKKLVKPPITPRDDSAVIGNKLFFAPHPLEAYKEFPSYYNTDEVYLPSDKTTLDYGIGKLVGADIVKLGKDIILDTCIEGIVANLSHATTLQNKKEFIFKLFLEYERKIFPMFKDDYRIHFATNGGHADGCFMPVKPGLVMTTRYWKNYDNILPGWEKISLRQPSFADSPAPLNPKARNQEASNAKWFLPDPKTGKPQSVPHFNRYVTRFCDKWFGNYSETFFEVNFVPIDENNIVCINGNDHNMDVFEELDKRGVKCHIVPYRTRAFWDGGVHCATLDVRRRGVLNDYFPERGSYGLKSITSSHFKDLTSFLPQYEQWKKDNGYISHMV